MSGWWFAAAAMTALVLVALVLPLVRRNRRPSLDRSAYDISVFRDQLAEIEREVDRGLLSGEQAEAARNEVKRRILSAADGADPGGRKDGSEDRAPVLAVAIAVAAPALAVAVYFGLGSQDTPDFPLAQPNPSSPTTAGPASGATIAPDLVSAVARLEQRLREQPDDGRGWALLGRSYMTLERFADAAEAFRQALQLESGDPELAADYGEALMAAAGGMVGEVARQAFADALAMQPSNPRARFYLAAERAQQGDLRGAAQGWYDLIALSSPTSPWLAVVREELARAVAEAGIDPATLEPSPEVRALIDRPDLAEPAGERATGGEGTPSDR